MSIQAVGWVLENSQTTNPIDRLVLLSLANHANAGTGQCNPGYRRIAHEAGISPSTVTASIQRLAALGELVVVRSGSGTRSADYHLPWLSTVLSPLAPQPDISAMQPPASARLPRASDSASARQNGSSAREEGSSARAGARNQEPEIDKPRSNAGNDHAKVRAAMDDARRALGRDRTRPVTEPDPKVDSE